MAHVMQGGRRIRPSPSLRDLRAHAARGFERLPEPLRRLDSAASYPVKIADALVALTEDVDRRLAAQERCHE
jgi:nicotinate phosphoribosyltransferase